MLGSLLLELSSSGVSDRSSKVSSRSSGVSDTSANVPFDLASSLEVKLGSFSSINSVSDTSPGSSALGLSSSSLSIELSVLSSCSVSVTHECLQLCKNILSLSLSHLLEQLSSDFVDSSGVLKFFLSEDVDSTSDISRMSSEPSLVKLSLLESDGSHLQLGGLSL